MKKNATVPKELHNIGIIAGVWCAIFVTTGVVFSGYHLEDNHNWFLLDRMFNEEGGTIWSVTSFWVRNFLQQRFNPFLWVYRISLFKIFHLNWTLYYIQNGLLGVATSICLYKSARNFSFSVFRSFCLTALIFSGSQFRAYTRLVTAEPLGMLLLSVIILIISNTNREKRPLSKLVLLVPLLVIMSMTKEAFILIIPSLALAYVFIVSKSDWIGQSKKKRLSVLVTTISLALVTTELYFIVFKIGMNNLGYAGVEKEAFTPGKGLLLLRSLLGTNIHIVLYMAILYAIVTSRNRFDKKKSINLGYAIVLFLSIAIPQIVLHYKTGIFERYFFPYIVGLAFLTAYSFKLVDFYQDRVAKGMLTIALMAVIVLNGAKSLYYSVEMAREGFETEKMLAAAASSIQKGGYAVLVKSSLINGFGESAAVNLRSKSTFGVDSIYFQYIENDSIVDLLSRRNLEMSKTERPNYLASLNYRLDYFHRNMLFDTAQTVERKPDCIILDFPPSYKLFVDCNAWYIPKDYKRIDFPRAHISLLLRNRAS